MCVGMWVNFFSTKISRAIGFGINSTSMCMGMSL